MMQFHELNLHESPIQRKTLQIKCSSHLLLNLISSLFEIVHWNKSGVLVQYYFFFYHGRSTRQRTSPWRSADASWSPSSTTPRSPAWWWASCAAPTSPPWTLTASRTPTSKRKCWDLKTHCIKGWLWFRVDATQGVFYVIEMPLT